MFGLFAPRRTPPQRVEPTLQGRSDAPYDTWQNLPPIITPATVAGVSVSSESAVSHPTVYACMNVIAQDVAMMPEYLYRERGASRRHATDHPVYGLLNRPCPLMTAYQYWYRVLFEKLHYGNHYSYIERRDGVPVALWPIESGRCEPFWFKDPMSGRSLRAYRVSGQDGVQQPVLLDHEVFHVAHLPVLRGPWSGLKGVSVWQWYQLETLGGALAVETYAQSMLANGANLSGFVSVESDLEPDTQKVLREEINAAYGGPKKAGKIGIFGNGAKYHPLAQSNKDAELIENRRFNRSVLAGILRVSAHFINDLEKATFSNIGHLDLSHYKYCLRPHLVDLAQGLGTALLTPEEQVIHYVDHDESEMLRGDQKTLGEVLEKAVNNARMTPNEARAITNLPPRPGGDELFINAAAVPVRLAAQGLAAKAGAAQQPTATTTPTETETDL